LIYAVVAFQKKSLKSKLICLQALISLCSSLSDIKKCMLSLCCCYINNKKSQKLTYADHIDSLLHGWLRCSGNSWGDNQWGSS